MTNMDHPSVTCRQAADWQTELAGATTSGTELCRLLRLPPALAAPPRGWPVRVPRPFLSRIAPGDPTDPLLLQVLPRQEEAASPADFSPDPLGEATGSAVPGLLWKYAGRSLIVATGRCGVHCRFCFRRHFPFADSPPGLVRIPHHGGTEDTETTGSGLEAWGPALAVIAREESLREVVLSGGDPLVLDDDLLTQLIDRLADIAHLRRLRIHTRMPIVIPSRVTEELTDLFRGTRLTTIVVIHVNHAREIDVAVADALSRLVDAGIPVLSQTVLLRGVNDDPDALADLFEHLVDLRVMPYYLHQLDRVAGAAHFEVPEPRGRELIAQVRARLPGYAVPRYVRELPGASGKVWLV